MDFREAFILALQKNGPVHMTNIDIVRITSAKGNKGDFHIMSDGSGGLLYSVVSDKNNSELVLEETP